MTQQVKRVKQELDSQGRDGDILSPEELIKEDLFRGIPFKFLQLNGSSVVRRILKKDDVLCEEGEFGATAFIIKKGSFRIELNSQTGVRLRTRSAGGLWGWLGKLKTAATEVVSGHAPKLVDLGGEEMRQGQEIIRTAEDVILGEMSCLNRSRRSATIIAREDCEVLEIRRNVLDMLLRNRASRDILDKVYRSRAVSQLAKMPLFGDLDEASRREASDWLTKRVSLVRVDPGQPIFRQGDRADNFYLISLGFVRVSQKIGDIERVAAYRGPGNYIGEIALLTQLDDVFSSEEVVRRGVRTATCAALDHVELFQIKGDEFKELLQKFPAIREKFVARAKQVLREDQEAQQKAVESSNDLWGQLGLYGAQNLLVIDLERCTRCDECTKACADTHQGVTRLIRDGMRFDHFLIASSCRSCMDPYCMVGCPVDAIHRNGESLQIEIEDYCIGCGMCAENCPYGNINMHGFKKTVVDSDNRRKAVIQQRATTCDMCAEIDGRPSCVHACPHNAAFRVSGPEFKEML